MVLGGRNTWLRRLYCHVIATPRVSGLAKATHSDVCVTFSAHPAKQSRSVLLHLFIGLLICFDSVFGLSASFTCTHAVSLIHSYVLSLSSVCA